MIRKLINPQDIPTRARMRILSSSIPTVMAYRITPNISVANHETITIIFHFLGLSPFYSASSAIFLLKKTNANISNIISDWFNYFIGFNDLYRPNI